MSWTEMETGLTFLMLTPPLAAVSTSALWAQGILDWIILSVWQCVFYTLRCEHLTRLYHTDHTPATKYRELQLQNENLWHVKLEIEIFVHILSPNPVVNQRLHPSHQLNTILCQPSQRYSATGGPTQVSRLGTAGKTIQSNDFIVKMNQVLWFYYSQVSLIFFAISHWNYKTNLDNNSYLLQNGVLSSLSWFYNDRMLRKIQDKFGKVVKHSWQMYYPRRNFFWIALKFRAFGIINKCGAGWCGVRSVRWQPSLSKPRSPPLFVVLNSR